MPTLLLISSDYLQAIAYYTKVIGRIDAPMFATLRYGQNNTLVEQNNQIPHLACTLCRARKVISSSSLSVHPILIHAASLL